MGFYSDIAEYYERIFPFNQAQADFVLKRLAGKSFEDTLMLDVGCGTGLLDFYFAERGIQLTGIDLDSEMIKMAKKHVDEHANNPVFMEMSMLKLKDHFKCNHFNICICLGNTIVHLRNTREIEYLLRQLAVVTKPGGDLVIQLVNYDRILDQGIDHLPEIINDSLKFERNYTYLRAENRIRFDTKLSFDQNETVCKHSVKLYPLRSTELKHLLKKSSFINVDMYGGFDGSPYTPESSALVISCQKVR